MGPLSEIAGRTTPLLHTDAIIDSSNTLILWEHDNPAAYCNTWSASLDHWDVGHQGGFMVL